MDVVSHTMFGLYKSNMVYVLLDRNTGEGISTVLPPLLPLVQMLSL